MRIWVDRVVSLLLLLVYTSFVLYLFTFVSPNYVLIRVNDTGEVSNFATMYTSGGCTATLVELADGGLLTDKFACVRINAIKQ